jgi:hypothetical protein
MTTRALGTEDSMPVVDVTTSSSVRLSANTRQPIAD